MFHLFLMFFVPYTEILNCLGRQHQKIWTEPKYFIIFLVSSLVNLLFIVTQAFLTSVYIFNTWPIMSSNFSFVRLYKLLMSFFMFKAAFSRAALLLNIFKFCWPWFWTKKKKKRKKKAWDSSNSVEFIFIWFSIWVGQCFTSIPFPPMKHFTRYLTPRVVLIDEHDSAVTSGTRPLGIWI